MGYVWLLVLAGLYMLPTIVAAQRNHANLSAISLINVLLGWTLIGWIVALVMAVWQGQPRQAPR